MPGTLTAANVRKWLKGGRRQVEGCGWKVGDGDWDCGLLTGDQGVWGLWAEGLGLWAGGLGLWVGAFGTNPLAYADSHTQEGHMHNQAVGMGTHLKHSHFQISVHHIAIVQVG